jgi:hypothetical protein
MIHVYAPMCKNFFRPALCRPTFRNAAVLALVVCGLAAWTARPASAQQNGTQSYTADRLAVFLDCAQGCPTTFVRQEMTMVDYVRDRELAHVHVLVTEQNTGAGGEAITFDLIGLGAFEGMDYSTVFTTSANATEDEERNGFLRTLQMALVPYLMQTPFADRMTLDIEDLEEGLVQAVPTDDPWKSWTIEIYGDGEADFESSQYSVDARYGVFVERVTEQWKIQLRPYFNYNYDKFEREDETITSTSRRDGFDSYVIKSISPHWSVGLFGDLFTSTFDNIDMRYRAMPAVEYSVYPYREATRRQLTVAYRIGGSHVSYNDTTIYDEISEMLPEHSLSAAYEVTQPWGEIDVGMEATQFINDGSKYSVEFGGGIEVRLTRGLSVDFGGQFELVNNQLNLPKGDATLDEVLLRRRQLATDYEASIGFGFTYRFGSIYNNVVNTRFGGGVF